MANLFTSSGFVPGNCIENLAGESIDFSRLPQFLRVLLTTDGTVTKSLESYFWEPVRVDNVGQSFVQLETEEPFIACAPGDQVLSRQVELVGQHSKRVLTRAHSFIRMDQLPTNIAQKLERGRLGIGELLRECDLETYREIMDFGLTEDSVWRIYRIVMKGQPCIKITEQFPLTVYRED